MIEVAIALMIISAGVVLTLALYLAYLIVGGPGDNEL